MVAHKTLTNHRSEHRTLTEYIATQGVRISDPAIAGLRGMRSYGLDTIAGGVHPQDAVDVEPHDAEVGLFGDSTEAGDLHRVAEPDADGGHYPLAARLGRVLQVPHAEPADHPGKKLGVTRIPRLARGICTRDARSGEKNEEEDGEELVLAAGALHGWAS